MSNVIRSISANLTEFKNTVNHNAELVANKVQMAAFDAFEKIKQISRIYTPLALALAAVYLAIHMTPGTFITINISIPQVLLILCAIPVIQRFSEHLGVDLNFNHLIR